MRPIDYTLISVSFMPLFEGTLCGQRNPVKWSEEDGGGAGSGAASGN